MIKDILTRYKVEIGRSFTEEEVNGYYYASCDMLFTMNLYFCISDVVYRYLLRKMKVIRALVMYQEFKEVRYLNRLERMHEL